MRQTSKVGGKFRERVTLCKQPENILSEEYSRSIKQSSNTNRMLEGNK